MERTDATAKEKSWFALRDLKRRNAKQPAYKMLHERGIQCFTPLVRRMVVVKGKHQPVEEPFMQDLLFVKESRETLDPIVADIPTLQYRYRHGAPHTPIVIRAEEMERFMQAVASCPQPRYLRPEEITPAMKNRPIRIIGGPLNGCTGTLVTIRGSKKRHLLVDIPMVLAALVEVEPEFIELL